jgi:hypothetical protein
VHAAQPAAPQPQAGELGAEGEHARAGLAQRAPPARGKIARAEAVDQQPHLHAARRGARQRVGDEAAGLVVGIDVALEEHFALRGVDRRDQGGKVLLAVAQQGEAVAAGVLHATQARSISALTAR